MGFSRQELNDDAIQWNRIQAELESADDHDPDDPLLIDGLTPSGDADSEDEDSSGKGGLGEGGKSKRAGGRGSRKGKVIAKKSPRTIPPIASPEIASERFAKVKSAAEKIKRHKKAGFNEEKAYRKGKAIFEPTSRRFGFVLYSSPGYVRLELRDGTQMTHGKPPLDDRKNFVLANFNRMDNKTMAEVLEISVHTMRRLCHEYGLKRHGKKNKENAEKSA